MVCETRSLEISNSIFRRVLRTALLAAAVGLLIASWTSADAVTACGWTKLGTELALELSVDRGRGVVGQLGLEELRPGAPESSPAARPSVLTPSAAPPNDMWTLSFGVQMTTFLEISVHTFAA